MCIPGFVFRYSKKFRRKWPPKVHYTALSCSRRGPLRHVCGQTINPTAMICTFLEISTDLDVHPRTGFALFGQNRRIITHVCRHTNHRTTMVHAFLESSSNLDVHPRICFSIFEIISPELASKSTLYGYVMLTKGSIALRLRANY